MYIYTFNQYSLNIKCKTFLTELIHTNKIKVKSQSLIQCGDA